MFDFTSIFNDVFAGLFDQLIELIFGGFLAALFGVS